MSATLSPSHVPDASAGGSASASEKHATSTATLSAGAPPPAHAPVSASTPKLRSCVVCRRRKVRCDKLSPCSHCRRANIACVFPSDDRPPRWARRLERLTSEPASTPAMPSTGPDHQTVQVMERLRSLEGLVKELSSQLEQTNAAAGSEAGGSASATSPPQGAGSHSQDFDPHGDVSSHASTANMQKHFGRLVLKDTNRSRYVSSGFWSRVDLYGLKMDLAGDESDSSEEYHHPQSDPSTREPASSIQELDRTPAERHAFLFRHNLSSYQPDGHEFRPLPSQIPFLLNTFSENVNMFTQVVHMPTIDKIVRGLRGGRDSAIAASDEALLCSIFYAALISMEEDEVITNFGTTKGELSLKYRLGLEHALAKADFLNAPNLTLVQALCIFLALARRHDSPRFVWMMTGLATRMAQSLGLHRDGSHFPQLAPYEVEIRKRVWWTLCFLDVRSSEDQGMDYTILPGSFDTRFPLNVKDADISPETREPPSERLGLTDMTMPIAIYNICDLTRRIMDNDRAPTLEEQRRLINELYGTVERGYLQYAKDSDGSAAWWMGVTAIRLTMAKMTLFINFPVLFSQSGEEAAIDTRNILLVAAIEVAEWNHILNEEPTARQWRWIYQTYTHWHAIVILLIEIARRPLSPVVERAWLALRSSWLIPAQGSGWDKKLQVWVPLRRLMAAARKHRDSEIERLRRDEHAGLQTAAEDAGIPIPTSVCPFLSEEELRRHWNNLFTAELPTAGSQFTEAPQFRDDTHPSIRSQEAQAPPRLKWDSLHATGQDGFAAMSGVGSQSSQAFSAAVHKSPAGNATHQISLGAVSHESEPLFGQSAFTSSVSVPPAWPGPQQYTGDVVPWLWADADPSTDVFGADLDINMDSESDWHNWLESAKNMELNLDGI
ncbi:unnamed protein product [Discula destructiva]